MAFLPKYDKVTNIEIGRTSADKMTITNVLYFSSRVVSPDGDMVDPLTRINDFNPGGVHHNHKYWELEFALDTDWLETVGTPVSRWAYTQHVNAANTLPAIDENGANIPIEFMEVNIREHDGDPTVLQYANAKANVLICISEISEFSNEDGTPHQTVTFRFICLQDVVRS